MQRMCEKIMELLEKHAWFETYKHIQGFWRLLYVYLYGKVRMWFEGMVFRCMLYEYDQVTWKRNKKCISQSNSLSTDSHPIRKLNFRFRISRLG